MRGVFILALLALPVAGCRHDLPRPLEPRPAVVLAGIDSSLASHDVQQALLRQMPGASAPVGDFYDRSGHRFAWCDQSGVLPAARILLDTLRRAGEHGLNPGDYDLGELERLAGRIDERSPDGALASRLADFDLLATAAFFQYASDLSTGRVHPGDVHDGWHTSPSELDLVGALDRALAGEDLLELLEALPPPHAGYARLREALQALHDAEAAGGWSTVPDGPKLEAGSRGPRVSLLRRRLAAFPASGGAEDRFDKALVEAVRRFQGLHGLEPDGKVGERTLAALNVPVEWRIRQVELNLERWRWIPRELGDPCIVVNIPAFDLELVRDRSPVWRSRIVVGKAYTPTPVFSDRIVSVVVNPPWNVPESIAVGEYLPELRKDPRALERHGLRLFEGSGDKAREVDPATVDWSGVDENGFPYRMRQDPGPDNALGRLKFELTNEFHIYLHDTPASHLFGRSERGLSHGCIRVERPFELAAEMLDGPALDGLRDALEEAEERRLPVDPDVPVHILYWTAWVDGSGLLRFAPDLYDFDRDQMAALQRRGALPGGDSASSATR
jgi:murein L,D-transpeptidase YcbB/YkuD